MKKCILFGGAVGCSKTPTALYLSQRLNLPIFNNDAIRTEVIEDLKSFDEAEYINRRDARLMEMLKSSHSFILDASIDREFMRVTEVLKKNNYQFFVISFDLSKDFLVELYKAKGYFESLERIDKLLSEHDNFLKNNKDIINVSINDKDFINRLEISLKSVSEFL